MWIGFAALLEVGTGAVLMVSPSLFTRLLFGGEMTAPGEALGRLSGLALLCLPAACWPRRGESGISASALSALLSFSALAAAYLLSVGISGDRTGILLWPAAATHLVLGLLLGLTWIRNWDEAKWHQDEVRPL